jgi:PIN domain nuclease of toxin-antitoxin system
MGSQPVIVLDTHALVWWVAGAEQLSTRARRAVAAAARQGAVTASAISVFEIATAVRRGRLVLTAALDQWLEDLRLLPELRIEPVNADIARLAGKFDDSTPGDPADRIIAATAISLRCRLVTADERLRRLRDVETVW